MLILYRRVSMSVRTIYITDFDMKRLRQLVQGTKAWSEKDREYMEDLEEELERAVVVPSKDVPPDVITMNSELQVKDVDTGNKLIFRLVFPRDADFERGKVSILAPIGMALIGYRTGDTVNWKVPSGIRRLKIEEVLYQPLKMSPNQGADALRTCGSEPVNLIYTESIPSCYLPAFLGSAEFFRFPIWGSTSGLPILASMQRARV
jgi:regulator of nucleoside diphosphate kinase